MAVNQRQVTLPHLPSLLQNLAKNYVKHHFCWMVAVKVDFHLFPPKLLGPRRKQLSSEKEYPDYRRLFTAFTGRVQFRSCRSRPLAIAVYNRDIFQWSAPRRGPAETESVSARPRHRGRDEHTTFEGHAPQVLQFQPCLRTA